jgi:oligopeptide transport system ATP-binding protein
LTYLFIAHDLSMVRYVSDEVGVMYLGKLVELAGCNELYQHPQHPYTQGLIRSAPDAWAALARMKKTIPIEGDIPSPISPPPGCRFHTRCAFAQGICKEAEPPLTDRGGGHLTACHFAP